MFTHSMDEEQDFEPVSYAYGSKKMSRNVKGVGS